MALALFITFGGGGGGDGGPSGGLVAVLLIVALVGVPVGVGLLLRRRDRRRGDDGDQRPEATMSRPPASGVFDASWSRSEAFDPWARSTKREWTVVGALAAVVLVLLLISQL